MSGVHVKLLQMRDRMFAHHDKDSRLVDSETGVDLFQLVLTVKNGIIHPAVQLAFPSDYQLGQVEELCSALYAKCMSKAESYLTRCIGEAPRDGAYRVSTDFQSRCPLLIESELSSELSRMHLKETKRRPPPDNFE
jgi:hypothetical protein